MEIIDFWKLKSTKVSVHAIEAQEIYEIYLYFNYIINMALLIKIIR